MWLIQVAVLIICVLEAVTEKYVIAMKSGQTPDYARNNNMEHYLSAAYFISIMAAFYMLFPHWQLVVVAACLRWICLGPFLNTLRGVPFFYLSDRGMDKAMKKVFGHYAGHAAFSLAILIIGIVDILFL